jgi:group I intron endonuclease
MTEGVIYRYKSPSGKYYIGQTIDEGKRRVKFLNNNLHYGGPKIEAARRKYGPENFEYTVLMKVIGDNPDEVKHYLNQLEQFFIVKYNSIKEGYNLQEGGNSHRGQTPWNKGMKMDKPSLLRGIKLSNEHKRKLSESHKGRTPWNKGIPHSEEQKIKLRISRQGRIFSEETRRKISIGNKGKISHIKGKHRVYNPDGTYHYE